MYHEILSLSSSPALGFMPYHILSKNPAAGSSCLSRSSVWWQRHFEMLYPARLKAEEGNLGPEEGGGLYRLQIHTTALSCSLLSQINTKYVQIVSPVSITDSVDINLSKLWEIVEDRGAWCATVHGVAKSQIWLSSWKQVYRLFQNGFNLLHCIYVYQLKETGATSSAGWDCLWTRDFVSYLGLHLPRVFILKPLRSTLNSLKIIW